MDCEGRKNYKYAPYEVIATDGPCVDQTCGEEIQPGQMYVPTSDGPLHVYCDRRRRRLSLDLPYYGWPF